MAKILVFDDNSKSYASGEGIIIQPQGTRLVNEINVDDFSDEEKDQLRTNLHDEATLNLILQKRGKHISMKIEKEK